MCSMQMHHPAPPIKLNGISMFSPWNGYAGGPEQLMFFMELNIPPERLERLQMSLKFAQEKMT